MDKNYDLIAVRDLRMGDVGKSIIITQQGSPFAGKLDQVFAFVNGTKTHMSIEVKAGTSKVKLERLEPGYIVQLEREED